MQDSQPRFVPLAVKTVVCHTVTYFMMGALAFHFLHYAELFNKPGSGLRASGELVDHVRASTVRVFLHSSFFFGVLSVSRDFIWT